MAGDAAEIARALGGRRSGSGWIARCPVPAHGRGRGDRNPSLSIGGDGEGAALVFCHAGCRQEEVIERLREMRLWPGNGASHPICAPPKNLDGWRPITPVPDDAPRQKPRHQRHGEPSRYWVYRDKRGKTLGLTCRFDLGGGKEVLPWTYCQDREGNREWRFQAFPEPRPLYGLDRLAARPDAPVLVGEGEKGSVAAQELFPDYVVVTWPGGTGAVKKADWRPLEGRRVLVWPDHDDAGVRAAEDVARACLGAGAAEVRTAEVPRDFPERWDLADPLPEGWTGEKLRRLMQSAPRVHPQNLAGNGELGLGMLPVLNAGELMALDLPERAKLLPWLPEGGLAMVFGPRGIGKTYFVLSLAVSLARGEAFLKWKAAKPAGVLIVDGEMALTDLRDRLQAMLPGKPLAPLEVLSHEYVFAQCGRDLNLGCKEWQASVKAYLSEHPEIRVLILDNLSCLLPSVAEDKRDEWATKVLPFIIWLRRRGIAAVFVHHAGKGGEQRGTSAREDNLDTVVRLSHVPGHDAPHGAQFVIKFSKARGVYGEDVAEIEARLETDAEGTPAWTWKDVEASNETRLLSLARDGIESVSEAAEELGLSKGAVSKLKKRLIGKGLFAPGRELKLADEKVSYPGNFGGEVSRAGNL